MRSWLRLLLLLLLAWGTRPAVAQPRRKPPTRPRPAVVMLNSPLPDPVPRPLTRHDSLLLAAAANDVPRARHLLARGANVNQPYLDPDSLSYVKDGLTLPDWSQVRERQTALHLAVERGHLEMTDLLLRHGANPLQPGWQQQTALCAALYYVPNQLAIIERLLATGLNPDSARCWKSPLAVVLDYNHGMRQLHESYRARQSARAVPRRRARYGMARGRQLEEALHPLRSDSLNLHLLHLLTAAGAWPTWVDLHQAVRSHEPALARYLLTHGVGPDASEPGSGRTALHLAVEAQDSALLQLLVAQGANLNAMSQSGETPLQVAAGQPSPRLAALLLAAGAAAGGFPGAAACPDCRDGLGSTPLHRAVQAAQPATVRLLLAAGAPPNACDAEQYTPLQLAVRNYPEAYQQRSRNYDDWGLTETFEVKPVKVTLPEPNANEVLRLLLAAGASPNVTDFAGSGPLATAVANGDTLRVGWLLRAGANPNQADRFGNPPLYGVHSVAVLRQMRAAGARFGAASSAVLLNPTWLDQPVPLAIAAAALADGGDLHETTSDGDTALHLAAADPVADLGTAAFYLSHGADPAARNHAGWTPLTTAVVCQRPALVQLLLDAGARPASDPSPLTAAARLGSEALVGLLLRYGAPVNQADSLTNATALLAAVRSGTCTPAIAGLLLGAGANPNVADSAGYSPLHRLVQQCQGRTEPLAAARQNAWNDLTPAEQQAQQQAAAWADARLLALGRLLLSHGARPDSRNAAGESVTAALRAAGTPACQQLLAEVAKGR